MDQAEDPMPRARKGEGILKAHDATHPSWESQSWETKRLGGGTRRETLERVHPFSPAHVHQNMYTGGRAELAGWGHTVKQNEPSHRPRGRRTCQSK